MFLSLYSEFCLCMTDEVEVLDRSFTSWSCVSLYESWFTFLARNNQNQSSKISVHNPLVSPPVMSFSRSIFQRTKALWDWSGWPELYWSIVDVNELCIYFIKTCFCGGKVFRKQLAWCLSSAEQTTEGCSCIIKYTKARKKQEYPTPSVLLRSVLESMPLMNRYDILITTTHPCTGNAPPRWHYFCQLLHLYT